MKLHVAYPDTGCNKTIIIDDENKVRVFYDKKLSDEVPADSLGTEFKGYVFRITGGCDKAGFPMKQGVLTSSRVKLLLPKGTVGFQEWRGGKGERRRKSVRGCIVSPDIAVLNLIVTKKGDTDIDGLTNATKPRTLGPKRASRIRKLFNLTKNDDVRDYVIKHKVTMKDGKEVLVAPRIQRLLTPSKLRRQRQLKKTVEGRKRSRVQQKKNYRKVYDAYLADKKKKAEAKKEDKTVQGTATEKKVEKKVEKKEQKVEKKAPVKTEKKENKKPVEKKTTEKKPVEKKTTEKKQPEKKKGGDKKKQPEKKTTEKVVKKTEEKKKPAPKKEKKGGKKGGNKATKKPEEKK